MCADPATFLRKHQGRMVELSILKGKAIEYKEKTQYADLRVNNLTTVITRLEAAIKELEQMLVGKKSGEEIDALHETLIAIDKVAEDEINWGKKIGYTVQGKGAKRRKTHNGSR